MTETTDTKTTAGNTEARPSEVTAQCDYSTTIVFTDDCPSSGCRICGDPAEMWFGACFKCAEAENVIATGEDMYDKKVAETAMEKLKYILRLYGVTSNARSQRQPEAAEKGLI